MKVYKVGADGNYLTARDLLKRLAQNVTSQDQFTVTAQVKICYKISDDGQMVKWKPSMQLVGPDGQPSKHDHFGLGEEDLFQKMFHLGGRTRAGMPIGYEYEKLSEGYANLPDPSSSSKPPPDKGGSGVAAGEGAQKLYEEKKHTTSPVKSPVKVPVIAPKAKY